VTPSEVSARALAVLLAGMGTLHLVTPAPFERLVPRWLGSPRAWVVATGLAEIASGAALVPAATRRAGAWAAAATLVVVFPGNVQMAVDAGAPTTAIWTFPGNTTTSVAAATRRAGAWAAAATLVVVFPGNVQMAVDAGAPTTPVTVALWLRLPLQAPLVAWALRHTRRPGPPGAAPDRARRGRSAGG